MRYYVWGAILVNVILIVLLAVNVRGFLSPFALTYGVIGSIFFAIPFLRDQRARNIYDILKDASVSGGGKIFERAAEKRGLRLSNLQPSWTDIYLVLAGLFFIGASCVVGLLAWILSP